MKEQSEEDRRVAMKLYQNAKIQMIAAMSVFGTIGIFVRYIPLPSSVIAFARGLIGTLFLVLLLAVRRTPVSREEIRRNLKLLLLSGAALGFNWILLFESYRYTTVATTTLCYNMGPMFVILASPLVREKLTARKILCVAVSLLGMGFVSGALQNDLPAIGELRGILLGLGAAVLYASVILMNKLIRDISAYAKTIMQLGTAAVVIFPYILLTENVTAMRPEPLAVVLLIFVGVVHTGINYAIYFNAMKDLKAQTSAILSYIDPVVAIVLSALILKEALTLGNVLGAILILGSALVSELPEKKKSA